MATDISICSSALVLIGADEITSFSDETREAKLCSLLYETTKDALLEMHPWRFSLGQVVLAKLAATPEYGFTNAFQVPPQAMRVIGVDNTAISYEIHEDMIFSDLDTMKATIQIDPGETDYPSYFVRALEFKMAEILAISLMGDESKQKIFERAGLRQMQSARSIDSQSQPTLAFDDGNFLLTNVRN